MQNRAAVFTSQPQAVEVYQQGAWWPGSLLGWRHDGAGGCQMWVRVELGGTEETAWTDLGTLRLPEARPAWEARVGRRLALAPEPVPAVPSRSANSPAARRSTAAGDPARTQHLPKVCDGDGPASGGRRVPSAGGKRRAPDVAAASPSSTSPAVPLGGSAEGVVPGRHRAPSPAAAADAGRHRAGDAGVRPPVCADRTQPPARSDLPPAGPVVRPGPVLLDVDQDCLTRPMRFDEGFVPARRSPWDALSGV